MGEMFVSREAAADVITISAKEYRQLVEAQVRIHVFSRYVNSKRYSVGREECAAFLDFELEDVQEDS